MLAVRHSGLVMYPSKQQFDQEIVTKTEEFENLYVDLASPPFRHMIKGTKQSQVASRSTEMNDEKIQNNEVKEANDQKLSTNARIRLAAQLFIESYSSKIDVAVDLNHPFPVSLSGLSDDEGKDIELLVTLLASAEKTGQRRFDCASKLIDFCNNMSSNEGNPVERLVYYFSLAIRHKINRFHCLRFTILVQFIQYFNMLRKIRFMSLISILELEQNI